MPSLYKMSAKTKRRAKERAQRQREIDRTLKDIAQSFRVLDPYTTSTYGSQWESYTNAYLQAQFRGIDRFSIPQYIPFVQGCTRGRTMRPSHLFGKCACYVCKLAEFAGLADRRRHCPDCGFCMFLLCPKTFVLVPGAGGAPPPRDCLCCGCAGPTNAAERRLWVWESCLENLLDSLQSL